MKNSLFILFLISLVMAETQKKWTFEKNIEPYFSEAVSCVYKDYVYVFSGISSLSGKPWEVDFHNWLFRFSPEDKSIEQIKVKNEIPVGRKKAAGVCIGDQFYIFGGSDHEGTLYNELLAYDFNQNSWSSIETTGDIPSPRISTTLQALNDKELIVFGGQLKASWSNEVFTLNLETREWKKISTKGDEVIPRSSFVANIIGDNMYVFGGLKFHGAKGYLNDLYELDLKNFKWKELKPKGAEPIGRVSFSGNVISPTQIFYFGGYNADGMYENEPLIYDIKENSFTVLNDLSNPIARFQHSGQFLKAQNQIVILGGYNDQVAYPGFLDQAAIFQL